MKNEQKRTRDMIGNQVKKISLFRFWYLALRRGVVIWAKDTNSVRQQN